MVDAQQDPSDARRWHRWQIGLALAAIVVVAALAGVVIGRSTDDHQVSTATGPSDTTAIDQDSATSEDTSPNGTVTPSAADQLDRFFAAAAVSDTGLRAAAKSINAHTGTDSITVDQAAVDGLTAADTYPVASAIPAGLPPDLLRAVLLVYSELVSRDRSLGCVGSTLRTTPVTDLEPGCLTLGGPAADRFPADLAAVRALAAATPAVTVAAPDSKAAEDLAVRLTTIELQNGGCGSVGGAIAKDLFKVTIYPKPTAPPNYPVQFDGDVDGVYFHADLNATGVWNIQLNAC